MKTFAKALIVFSFFASPAAAQAETPYGGWQTREIKALSPEQIGDLEAGRGMGLALSAELNGFPGPRHVLDLDAELNLSQQQRAAIEDLFAEMESEAQKLGAAILTREAALEASFRSGAVTESDLKAELAALGTLQGELRYTHLRYHLATKALLSPQQVAHYDRLRGYGGDGGDAGGSGHAGGHGSGHGGAH